MKSEAGSEKTNDSHQQKMQKRSKASGRPSPAAPGVVLTAGKILQLARMSHDDLMALAQHHNKHLGLEGDVLAPIMRGVAENAAVRPPAVHPFTLGGAPTKNEYQAAWKSISKRSGIPLLAPIELQAALNAPGAPGLMVRKASAATTAAVVAIPMVMEPAQPPTHAQMYGSADQPPQQVNFAETLSTWLGVGPIDLPLLAPGAPSLPLRRLFVEVLEGGGSGRVGGGSGAGGNCQGSSKRRGGGVLSWSALAGKLQGDEKLGDLLKQVYEAYLLPLERQLPAGTRPTRLESWMHEDLRRRGALLAEHMVPTVEQVEARMKTARSAVWALQQHQCQRQHERGSSAAPMDVSAAAAAAPASKNSSFRAVAVTNAGAAVAAMKSEAVIEADEGKSSLEAAAAAAAVPAADGSVDTSMCSELQAAPAEATTDVAAMATNSTPLRLMSTAPLAPDIMQALRTAAVAAPSLLPAGIMATNAGKRSRKSGKGSKSSGKKRSRGSTASTGQEGPGARMDSSAGTGPAASMAPGFASTWLGVAGTDDPNGGSGNTDGGSTQDPDLVDPKVSALLAIVASLRELRAGPPGCASHPPDFRANFIARWEMLHAERAAAAAAAAEAAAAAAATATVAGAASSDPAAAGIGSCVRPREAQSVGYAVADQADRLDDRMENEGDAGDGLHEGPDAIRDPVSMDVEGHGGEEAADDGPVGGELGQRQVQQQQPRGLREPKRQRKRVEDFTSIDPQPRTSSRQRPSESSYRRPNQQSSSQQGPGQRQRAPNREALPPVPPPSQQRDRPSKGPSDEWRRSSPYPRPPAPPHYQPHRASPSVVPLMSTAASPYDSRLVASQLPPRPHRPPPTKGPAAGQQHLEEMRRHGHSHSRNQPFNSVAVNGMANSAEYYDRLAKRDSGRFDRGPGTSGQGAPGRPYPYPLQPGMGGKDAGGGWDDGAGGGSWGAYGPTRGGY